MRDCEVLSNGKWPQRANAMKTKDGHPTSPGKSECTTSHSVQLKARIEEALSRNVRTVPVRLEGKLVDVCLRRLCTCEANRGVVDSARTESSSKCNNRKPQFAMRL